VFLAIAAISFFWTIGAVLFIQFPPLAKNVLSGGEEVASLFLVVLSVGVAIGSVSISRLLRRHRLGALWPGLPVIVMGCFISARSTWCASWRRGAGAGT